MCHSANYLSSYFEFFKPFKTWVYGRSLTGIVGSNLARAWIFVSFVCCVEIYASGLSLVHRSRTEHGVSKCDHEFSTMRFWPIMGCCAMVKKIKSFFGKVLIVEYG
jgi:hypothetical protein